MRQSEAKPEVSSFEPLSREERKLLAVVKIFEKQARPRACALASADRSPIAPAAYACVRAIAGATAARRDQSGGASTKPSVLSAGASIRTRRFRGLYGVGCLSESESRFTVTTYAAFHLHRPDRARSRARPAATPALTFRRQTRKVLRRGHVNLARTLVQMLMPCLRSQFSCAPK